MTVDNDQSESMRRASLSSQTLKVSNSNYFKCFQNYYYGQRYLKPYPTYVTNISPTIQHWQIRDLLQVDKLNGDIFYTQKDIIKKYNMKRNASERQLKLKYSPTCFSHSDGGYLVTGGLLTSSSNIFSQDVESLTRETGIRGSRQANGLFSFYNPTTDSSKTFRVGEMINNSVGLSRYSKNQFKSYVCNNDCNLYEVDIGNNDSFAVTNKINCENSTSLNNVVQNEANPKLLTVTGDSSSIFLVDISCQNEVRKIKTKQDSGFGISYHPSGNMFATTFQDGTCLLYDIRFMANDEPLFKFKSTRPGHASGAFRNCRFSQNPLHNVLVILEHVGRVHLIDVRNLNYQNVDEHQVIVFPLALDQFANFKLKLSHSDSSEKAYGNENSQDKKGSDHLYFMDEDFKKNEKHDQISIYGQETTSLESNDFEFPVPLVYDYQYLAKNNPRLFKNYCYNPKTPLVDAPVNACEPPTLNSPLWDTLNERGHDNHTVSPTSTSRQAFARLYSNDYHRGDDDMDISSSASTDTVNVDHSSFTTYYSSSFNLSTSPIHGEMELAGMDWYDRHLIIGGDNGGILTWEINDMARRSFGSFSYA